MSYPTTLVLCFALLLCVASCGGDIPVTYYAKCLAGEYCERTGECRWSGCDEVRDAECKEHWICHRFGKCHYVRRHCRAASDDDCAQSEACKERRRCHVGPYGGCDTNARADQAWAGWQALDRGPR